MTIANDINERSSHDDIDLTHADIQSLSNADEITRLFTQLHYNTAERIEQSLQAMDIASEKLRHDVRRVERIAHNEDAYGVVFEVYLFEVRSLTNALRDELVQQFRDRSGEHLLVLTETAHPYERLDFVLAERYNQVITTADETLQIQPLPGNRSRLVRPRVLQVERLKPDEVVLRVLRRFTYTEGDTIAQHEKLLNAYVLATWSEPYFNNRALFSDYYLLNRLPEREKWKSSQAHAEMNGPYKQLRLLYEDAREGCSKQPLATIEHKLFTPVLQLLGFAPRIAQYNVNGVERDVYRLFASESVNTKDAEPLVLCIPCVWGRNLDGMDSPNKEGELRDKQTPEENPGAFVVSLLDSSEADWAIVTNGISWRLYSAKAHSRATNYYEIFLPETLEKQHSQQAFPYFWHLFRASVFQPATRSIAGESRSLSLLDDVLLQSDLHARTLGDKLKTRIFEEIFPNFAEGFVIHARQQGMLPTDLEQRDADERSRLLEPYFTATLTFLYRLLFLFYAESRDLLPVRQEHGYYQQSLQYLKQLIAGNAGELEDKVAERLSRYSASETTLYDQLQTLFAAIDKGNADRNVPVYNGGLFLTTPPPYHANEPQEVTVARFLQMHKIPDRQLALGLDRMARDVDEKQARAARAEDVNAHAYKLIFIDYKSLGVRHLGSIYEGLLEFKLRIAPEEMAVVKGKRTDEIIPLSEAHRTSRKPLKDKQGRERHYARGSIYLENDRRERKATGSYYTPDYIVKYIVEQTVGAVLKEKLDALVPVFREAQRVLDAEQRKAKQLKSSVNPEHETYKQFRVSLNEVFFDLKVLDPAMGSGHFLVEAVDYITDHMAKVLDRYKWSPIVYELATTRQKIQESMVQQGVSIDSDKLTDLNLLKRRVLKSCIYGVDLNPMAVELAKVSLWLDCFTLGAPLSFLDHHLKCGNSLIGARIDDAKQAVEVGQLSLFFGSTMWASVALATAGALEVAKRSDVTAEEVGLSKILHGEAEGTLAPYKRLLDIYLSRWFGNTIVKGKKGNSDVDKAVDFLRSPQAEQWYKTPSKGDILTEEQRKIVDIAKRAKEEYAFFHWEMEFPEVYFGLVPGTTTVVEMKENGGFDAVVGNPPYDELSEFAIGRALEEESYFTSDANYKLLGGGRLNWYHYFIMLALQVARLGGMHSFIIPMSLMGDQFTALLRKWFLEEHQLVVLDAFPQKDDPKRRIFFEAKLPTCIYLVRNTKLTEMFRVRVHPGNVILATSATYYPNLEDIRTIDSNLSIPLVSQSGWEILAKIARKPNLGKLVDVAARPTSGEIVFNQQFRKYLTEDDSYTLILRGSHVQRYEIADEAKQGEPLYLKKDLYIKEAKPGSKAFDHLKERVVYQECAAIDNWRRVVTTLLPAGFICGHKICYFTDYKIEEQALLAVFSSKFIDWYVTALSTNNSLPAYLIGGLRFPIFRFTTSLKDRTYYLDKAKLLYQQCVSKNDEACVLGFVEHHLSKEPEESDVVHDLLAFLAEQMLELNKRKRAMQREFLDWLVETLRVLPDKDGERLGIEVLTGKGKLQEYAGDYQKGEQALSPAELWEIVQKNRARLGVRLTLDGLKERVLSRYQNSLKDVLPLKAQLQRTDTLIDKVVYRLYGLTEEEIASVEGKG